MADGYFVVKLLLFIFFVGLGVISFITIFDADRRESIYICSRLMHAASILEYEKTETRLPEFFLEGMKKLLRPALLVLAFMACFTAFLVLILFQILSAWSCAKLVFVSDYPFYQVQGFGSSFLMFLIFVEFIWGMSFLKEACKSRTMQSTSSPPATARTSTSPAAAGARTLRSTSASPATGWSSACCSATTGAQCWAGRSCSPSSTSSTSSSTSSTYIPSHAARNAEDLQRGRAAAADRFRP